MKLLGAALLLVLAGVALTLGSLFGELAGPAMVGFLLVAIGGLLVVLDVILTRRVGRGRAH